MTLEYAASLARRGQIQCSKNHGPRPCSKPPRGFVPTRLISIGPQAAPLQLVESTALTGPYATLSYCWGGVKPLRTTKANLSTRLHHIPENSLPIVFLQAIQLARKLEIPYIWIDSLCIIQDSVEDWEAESERMCLYYKNGSINIAAAGSANPDMPLDKQIDDKWCPVDVKVHDLQETPSSINTRRLPDLSGSNRDLGTLFTRAWTFQESIFAPRTLNFTSQGVVWSCWGPDSLSDHYVDSSTKSTLRSAQLLDLLENSATPEGGSEKPSLSLWRDLVREYSSRLLTFPMDKLPAISGAAAQFYERLHCSYLAGHWYDDLPQSLAWYVMGQSSELRPLPIEYIAPSWSWASSNRHIDQPLWGKTMNSTLSSAANLLDVHCEVPGTNPYGKVSSGFIDLRGKTVAIGLNKFRDSYFAMTPDWTFFPDYTLRKSGDSISRAKVGEAISDFEASACCLHLASLIDAGSSNKLYAREPSATHYALVLGWSDREQTKFSRVGFLESSVSGSERAMKLFDGAIEKTVRII